MILDQINRLTGGRLGTLDVACPACGPERHSPVNRRRKVLRVWRLDPGFVTYHCARCGEHGYSRDRTAPTPNPERLAIARQVAAERERVAALKRLNKARWLWAQREPITGSPAEKYLRGTRKYGGPLPATLGFLPGRGKFSPALIAGFGLPDEPEPGRIELADTAVVAVHITSLTIDGSNKTRKIMIGRTGGGVPIVIAPPNDLFGLTVTEGIEDGLSAHEATGLGAWAAGCASRLPALAKAIPSYVECVSLLIDDDPAGRHHSARLAQALKRRGIEVRSIVLRRGAP